YASRMGARLTNNSWGGGGQNAAIYDAFRSSDALHLCAAGNDAQDTDARPHYPSGYDLDNIVSVAATDRNDQLAYFSNYGRESVDLAAPGHQILSTVPGNQYATFSGTSMATPHATGVAGLILTAFPEASNEEVKTRLMFGTDAVDALAAASASGGRLNAALALETDQVAPAAPQDLRGQASNTEVEVGWTATGDDGWCGRASGYVVKHAGQRVETPRPAATGTLETARFELLPSARERTVEVSLQVMDNVGNLSEARTASVSVPPAAPGSVAFEDDMDPSDGGWTVASGDWARVAEPGRGMVWTDSPQGDYQDRQNVNLVSAPISLAGLAHPKLQFECRHELEKYSDNVFVRVSTDGQKWDQVARLTGKSDWGIHSIDLSKYAGQTVQVRFNLYTNGQNTADGFYLDNVVVSG
ncbi:MAG: S8 family serine peptidase, partial [Candidatus Eremiobacterota bacterium]